MMTIKDRVRAYCSKIFAIQRSGGDGDTLKVARSLVKGFNLSVEEAFPLIQEWNATNASPPWRDADLRTKLNSAARSNLPVGYLLGQQGQFHHLPTRTTDAAQKAHRCETWPPLAPLIPADVQAIAALRCLPSDSVVLLANRGLLSTATVDGHRCFILHEKAFAQARRYDGKPIIHGGREIKSKNLPGSTGAFMGVELLGKTPPILLVEGVVGLLEAVAAIVLTGHTEWTALAATSSNSRFARDPELLGMLRGRRVRIVPDHDERGQGFDAAAAWMGELENAGAIADAVPLPTGCKDLGDIISMPTFHIETLNSLFSL